ncbi:Uncharacterised protein [Citrobacter koseri]|uniref:Uncharacterized protein n=1 Tax=Citrobacter koseri TaxID=545 RepID=A0A2X2VEZ5_CITKO|nr:Uncharacterised protein [Citrobacter koseri]
MDELVNRKDFCIFILMYLIDIMKNNIYLKVFLLRGKIEEWKGY